MSRSVNSGFGEGEDDDDSRSVDDAVVAHEDDEDVADDAGSPLCSRALLHLQRPRTAAHSRCNSLLRRCCHFSSS